MASLWRTATLLKKWHYNTLNRVERRFIDQVLFYGGDGSEDPSDEVLLADNEITPKMAAWIKSIGKKFLITENTKI